ncbi:major facilitator superfamily domain-containing protein [Zychaea mexicana]|uniref:major facilitator superfamily domain-containing protein n=1 Tax=Zychaea mexicana TaxID=64656 RepID=UPI0022FEF6D1|nr:major facilitator superfamily domain-containing protein [Zychaea mexicana]KAI9490679.1 major facilitator superfamily domain-containing protein [Zychaea mexicana]
MNDSRSRRSSLEETNTIVDVEINAYGGDDDISNKKAELQQHPPTDPGRFAGFRRGLLIFGIVLAMFMISLNTTVIAPAMSIITTDLTDDVSLQTWIATAYLLAFNSSQPLSGKFSDIFGRKPILIFGIFVFFAGSLINALTPNMQGLIAGRTVQGLGGGCVMTIAYVLVPDLAPLHLRPRFQSGLTVVYGLASVVGTLIGGAFVDKLTWRWDFWLNVILGGTALIIVTLLLKEPTKIENTSFFAKLKRIDFLGVILVISFVCCLLLALNWGRAYGWSSGHSLGPFIAAAVSLVGLIVVEGWVAAEPLLPPEIILNPAISIFYLYIICLGLGFIGTLYYGPIMFQAVFGADSTGSGIHLIPYMACLIVASIGSGLVLPLFPYVKFYLMLASVCNIIGFGLFYTVNENSSWAQQSCYLMLCGFAFGLSQQNTIMGVQSAADKKYIAVATALTNFFMMLACSIGVAICETMFQLFLAHQLSTIDPDTLAVAHEYGADSNYLYLKNMPADTQQPLIHAYMNALNKVFIMPLVAAGVAVICAFAAKNTRFGASENKAAATTNDEKVLSEKEERIA